MKIAGIDVGIKSCKLAILEDKLIYIGDYEKEKIKGVFAVGIDAPLSFPEKGTLRECEKKLLNLGIKIFPSGAKFFKRITLKGIEIAEELRKEGILVFEVYPFASRVLMKIAPNVKKRTKSGIAEIRKELQKFIEIPELTHDEIDAVISALTVKEFLNGRGFVLDGKDGKIILPGVNINK
ncbi:MAG: DUF429 domain-containing protein [Archaeoglobaceae archaeon]|nr:DUF429 domain-containing protein [Archaeoglobaceae archaeon]MCX8151580.1 DUF429 domain-containing protein [Archaeoglobaceae archaeon]MDW8013142.1 DUF429 domain-containing protein [Archaeoglobaceae archaeon]